jgi:hypothetical protein
MSDKIIKQTDLQECRKNCDIKEKTMSEKIDELKSDLNSLGTEIKVKLAGLSGELAKEFDGRYATKQTQIIVYGLVAIILTSFVGYLIKDAYTVKQSLSEEDIIRIIDDNYTQK